MTDLELSIELHQLLQVEKTIKILMERAGLNEAPVKNKDMAVDDQQEEPLKTPDRTGHRGQA